MYIYIYVLFIIWPRLLPWVAPPQARPASAERRRKPFVSGRPSCVFTADRPSVGSPSCRCWSRFWRIDGSFGGGFGMIWVPWLVSSCGFSPKVPPQDSLQVSQVPARLALQFGKATNDQIGRAELGHQSFMLALSGALALSLLWPRRIFRARNTACRSTLARRVLLKASSICARCLSH